MLMAFTAPPSAMVHANGAKLDFEKKVGDL
jgi:hypothetical protein